MSGIERIAAERKRQIEQEGWTPDHDDEHDDASLAVAGACYAGMAHYLNTARNEHQRQIMTEEADPSVLWPWDERWWKPSADRIRNLEKAGALIAAEIDRLERRGGECR